MKVGSIRPEFIIVGVANLTGIIALLASTETGGPLVNQSVELIQASPAITIAYGTAICYATGILAVQLTYFYPTRLIIESVRDERRADLLKIQEKFMSAQPDDGLTPAGKIMSRAFQALSGKEEAEPIRHIHSLLLTYARAVMPAELAHEYRYRRANRQVFVGMLPAAGFGLLAGLLSLPPDWGMLLALAGIFVLPSLYFSAKYQERVAQSVLLDLVLLRQLALLDQDAASGAEAGLALS